MSEGLPPHDQLLRVVRALVTRAPEAWGVLLAAPRFASAGPLLERLRQPEAAIAGLPDAEAAHLAEAILAAWQVLEPAVLPPEAGIRGPRSTWSVVPEVAWAVVVDGLSGAWEVEWDDGSRESLRRVPVEGALLQGSARVIGRNLNGERTILRATITTEVRRPVLRFSDGVLLLQDEAGRPGVGACLQVGLTELRTGPDGRAQVPPGVRGDVRLEGARIGSLGEQVDNDP